MKMVTGMIVGFIWMIAVFLVGFIIIANLQAHANDSGALVDSAATNWTTFIGYVWVAVALLALTPLIMVIIVFAGLFGALGGAGQ
jgi:hypothetical protein